LTSTSAGGSCRTLGAVSDQPDTIAGTQQRLGGRYVLGEVVGRGGMATVYRAHDEVLDRQVAIKLLHPHLAADPSFLDRFRREARAAAGLNHPNIVAVHDWGEDEAGPYLVLQLVDGVSLRDVLRARHRLSVAETMAVLVPAAAGLQAAHDAGLVHRDVKPENLLIGRDGTVRVTDFGLARAAASATATFGPEVLVGSPHYLAPEAVQGRPLGTSADVYALGIILYECLTGTVPHRADTPFATAMAHVEQAVPAPSDRIEELAGAVDELVLAATAREPADRPATAAALATRLRAVAAGPRPALTGLGALPRHDGPPAPPVRPAGPGPHPVDPNGLSPGRTVVVPVGEVETQLVTEPDGEAPVARRSPKRTRRRRRWPVVLVVLLALVGGSAAGGYLLWDRVLAPVTPIPSVLGAPVDSASEQLERAGFEVTVVEETAHDRAVPAGHVLGQDPTGDARRGEQVALLLSAGPRPVEIPEVVGQPVGAATVALTEADLGVRTERRYDEQVPAEVVVTADPEPGTIVDEGTEVVLVVSLGPEPLAVPQVVGLGLEEARRQLDRLELTITERRYDATTPAGTIIAQDPAPGAVRVAGDPVAVVVSDGPQPVELPNVRGERVADAVEALEALGLDVEVERRGGFSAFFNPDRVYDQDPGPGSTRLPGDLVVLYAYEP
jgi:eukaryotic-like serine/threonine-protein kinase